MAEPTRPDYEDVLEWTVPLGDDEKPLRYLNASELRQVAHGYSDRGIDQIAEAYQGVAELIDADENATEVEDLDPAQFQARFWGDDRDVTGGDAL